MDFKAKMLKRISALRKSLEDLERELELSVSSAPTKKRQSFMDQLQELEPGKWRKPASLKKSKPKTIKASI